MKKLSVFTLILLLLLSIPQKTPTFTGDNLSEIINQSPDYNVKDSFFYNIISHEGGLLGYNMALRLSGDEHEKVYADLFYRQAGIPHTKSEQYSDKVSRNIKMARDMNFYDGDILYRYIFNPVAGIGDNIDLPRSRMEKAVRSYIRQKFGTEDAAISGRKLKNAAEYFASCKADYLKIEYLSFDCYPAYTFPMVKACYIVTAGKDGITQSVKLTDYFLLSCREARIGYDFDVEYVFSRGRFKDVDLSAITEVFDIDTPDSEDPHFVLLAESFDNILNKNNYNDIFKDDIRAALSAIKHAGEIKSKLLPLALSGYDLSGSVCDYDKNYIEKCLFVGDSIFRGLSYYGPYDDVNIAYKVGVGSRNLLAETLDFNGQNMDFATVLLECKPSYVYIMLGMNDVNMISRDEYKDNFENILQVIEDTLPGSKVVLCSITPIRRTSFCPAERIKEYSLILKGIAEEKESVYYLDFFDFLSVNGVLADKFSSSDGIHMTVRAYDIMGRYILTRQIKPFTTENFDTFSKNDYRLDYNTAAYTFLTDRDKGVANPVKYNSRKSGV